MSGNPKNSIWLDIAFIVVGVIILLLLFMPAQYAGYRLAGYIGVGIFLLFLVWREVRRKKEKGKKENADTVDDRDE